MPQLLSKTIWLDAPESLRFADEPVAAPDEGEMLCRTEVSAISPGIGGSSKSIATIPVASTCNCTLAHFQKSPAFSTSSKRIL